MKIRLMLTTACVALMLLGATPAASAISASNTVGFGGGVNLTANVWVDNVSSAGINRCGGYATSVISNRTLSSVKNQTTAYPILSLYGSVWGLSIDNGDGTTSSTLTNFNRSGSYLSGNVCLAWNTIALGMRVNGTGNYNGVVRTVAASTS